MSKKYIAIEGNIGAGKTSLATKLSESLEARLVLEEFADNPFLPKFYEQRDRYAFPLELSFLAERYSQLKDVLNSMNLFDQYIISDYFISKSLIFSKANLQGSEYDLFAKMYYIIEQNLPKPDVLVYLYLPTPQLLNNIKKRGRSYEQNIEAEYLEEVHESYLEFIKQHPSMKILIIDTSGVDFVENISDFEEIKRIILKEHPLGVSRIKM